MKRLAKLLLGVFVLLAIILVAFRIAAAFRETTPLGALPPQGGALIETQEGAIYTLAHGDPQATPVLFAHGTAAWSGLWEPTLEVIGQGPYHTIGYDLPPFGYSQHDNAGDYRRTRQADRILALVTAMDIRPIVVAHSFGAGPVAEAVLRDPSAFAGLIVVAGAIGLNSHETPKALPLPLRNATLRETATAAVVANPLLTKRLLRSLIHVKDAATSEVVDVLQQPTTRSGYTSAVSAWLPTLLVPPTDALSTRPDQWAQLTVPTVFIWGDADTVTPLAQGTALAALVPDADLIVLPDVGHIPQIEAPETFQETLRRALDTLTAQ